MVGKKLGLVLYGTVLIGCLFGLMTLKGNGAYRACVESFPVLDVVTVGLGFPCLFGGCSLIAHGLFRREGVSATGPSRKTRKR